MALADVTNLNDPKRGRGVATALRPFFAPPRDSFCPTCVHAWWCPLTRAKRRDREAPHAIAVYASPGRRQPLGVRRSAVRMHWNGEWL